jgi:nickel-dependent lactate racemase
VTTGFAERQLQSVGDALVVVGPKAAPSGADVLELCRAALHRPVGSAPIGELAKAARRIAIVVSDASRDEPRHALLTALSELVPRARTSLIVASGTHAPGDGSVVPVEFRDLPLHVHDGGRSEDMHDLGKTSRNTRVRLNRVVAEADLVIATGRVRPHYFAGLSAGVKAIFPGCAASEDALKNHELKADPSARLGNVDENVCRLDMEEASGLLPGRLAILNVLCDLDGTPVAAESGHPVLAHRKLASAARALFDVALPPLDVLIVADRAPVTDSLYQASKLIAPAGAVLRSGGVVIVVADCSAGTGPLDRVNRGIYELGLRPQLPPVHAVWLVSTLPDAVVRSTYARPVDSLRSALALLEPRRGGEAVYGLWRAGEAIVSRADS